MFNGLEGNSRYLRTSTSQVRRYLEFRSVYAEKVIFFIEMSFPRD